MIISSIDTFASEYITLVRLRTDEGWGQVSPYNVQPDICYMGGITRCLQVAEMANQAGIPCTLHCANLSLVTLFSIHFMAAIENAGKYVEFSTEGLDYYPWQANLFSPNYEITDGRVSLSNKPGWGI